MLAGQRRAALLRRGAGAPPGFARNGASHTALKAMLTRVRGGTGRGRIVWKGDSTVAGQGGGSGAPHYLGNARAARPTAVAAALLSAAGWPTLDNGVVGDNGMALIGGSFAAYDTRLATAAPAWTSAGGGDFAGGNFLSTNTGPLDFTPGGAVDTFEVVHYRSNGFTLGFLIDGAVPASGPAAVTVTNAGGFAKVVLKAAAVGAHTLRTTCDVTSGAVRSIIAYDSTKSAIDMLVHASLGATSANQAAAGNWLNNDALGFDAPDLTIVAVGYNDQNAGASAASFAANLQTIAAKARLSGDVLLVAQPPAAGSFNAQAAAYRDAVLGVGAANGIATLSLFDYFGGTFTSALAARMADGQVHPSADLYAEIGSIHARTIAAMAR